MNVHFNPGRLAFRNWPLFMKFALPVAVCLSVMIALVSLASVSMKKTSHTLEDVAKTQLNLSVDLAEISGYVHSINGKLYNFMAKQGVSAMEAAASAAQSSSTSSSDAVDKLKAELTEKNAQIEKLKSQDDENKKLKGEIETLKAELADKQKSALTQADMDKVQTEVSALKQEIETKTKALEESEKKQADLLAQMEGQVSKIQSLEEQLKALDSADAPKSVEPQAGEEGAGEPDQATIDAADAAANENCALNEDIKAICQEIDTVMGRVSDIVKNMRSVNDKEKLNEVIKNLRSYKEAVGVLASMLDFGFQGAMSFTENFDKYYRDMIAMVDEVVQSAIKGTEDEAFQAVENARKGISFFITLAVSGILLSVLVAYLSAHMTTKRLKAISQATMELAKGRLDIDLEKLRSRDEAGTIVNSLFVFQGNSLALREAEAEKVMAQKQAEQDRILFMNQLADNFEKEIAVYIDSLSSSVGDVQSRASQLSLISDQAKAQSTNVAAASEEAAVNVRSVAAAVEELNASIREVIHQVGESAEISKSASAESAKANAVVKGLNDSAVKIGEIVGLISDISEKTNLLALNATIESARAGDAGKGFAVVAQEVKELAGQTSAATQDIENTIKEIQSDTLMAVKAIEAISQIIGKLDENMESVTHVADQQGQVTMEISQNTQEVSAGTQEVSVNIQEVTLKAEEVGEASMAMLQSSKKLADDSGKLKEKVAMFISSIRNQ